MTDYSPITTAYPPQHDGDSAPMKDKAADAAQAAKQASADVAQTAADKAKDVAQEASKQARDLVGEARSQIRQQAGSQHRNLVTNLRSLGDELGGMTTGSQPSGVVTEAVSQLRDRVHGAADWLDGREPGDLIDELRSLARRRPGVFLVGAGLAGVAAGRLTRGVVAVHSEDAATSTAHGVTSQDTAPAAVPADEYPTPRQYETGASGYAKPSGIGERNNGETGYGTESGAPYGATPEGGFAQPGYEQPGYPQPGYAQPGYREPGFAEPGYPQQGYPQQGNPQGGEEWR